MISFLRIPVSYFMNRYYKMKLVQLGENAKFKSLLEHQSHLETDEIRIKERILEPYKLIEKLHNTDSSSNPNQSKLLKQLYDLRDISNQDQACSHNRLGERLELEREYGIPQYPNLMGYIRSMNALQFDRCNKSMLFMASRVLGALSAVDLINLEQLRKQIDSEGSQEDARVNFERGIKKFSSDRAKWQSDFDFKSEQDSNGEIMKLFNEPCKILSERIEKALNIYETLADLNLLNRIPDTSNRLLEYGRICSFIRDFSKNHLK